MNYFLVKSEPFTYSWEQFEKDKETCWEGVRSYAGRLHLRAMKPGDKVLFYHSMEGLSVMGTAEVTREAYQDPTTSEDWSAVDVKCGDPFVVPVSLSVIKSDSLLKEMKLVKISRLSVSPVTRAEYERVCQLGNGG